MKVSQNTILKRKCVLVVAGLVGEVSAAQLPSFDPPLDLHQLESIDDTEKKILASTFN